MVCGEVRLRRSEIGGRRAEALGAARVVRSLVSWLEEFPLGWSKSGNRNGFIDSGFRKTKPSSAF